MAYAQTTYLQKQGINGKYSIHDIGCFLTAFCNLLTLRYNRDVNPLTLNAFFVNSNRYVDVDDGVRDDLEWGSVSYFDGNVKITRLVDRGTSQTAGLPNTNQAIVKFYYYSTRLQAFTTHFSLYDGDGWIIDSWDGVRKHISSTIYGQPVAFAEYTLSVPAPTPAPVPAAAPAVPATPRYQVVETYPLGKQIRLNKQPTNLWGMNYDFDTMVKNPVEVHNAGEIWTVTNKVHHQDGMDYYRRSGQVDGFNVADCDDYVEPPKAPVDIPKPEKLTLVVSVMAFDSSAGAEQHKGIAKAIGPGDYFVFAKKGIAWNLTTDNVKDQNLWVNTLDNKPEEAESNPEPVPVEAPTPTPVIAAAELPSTPVTAMPAEPAFKLVLHFLKPDKQPVKYRAVNQVPVEVQDFVTNKKAVMAEYNKVGGVIKPVPVVAWFLGPDGAKYYLAQQVYIKGQAYGIRQDLLDELKKRGALDFNSDGKVDMDDIAQLGGYIATEGKGFYQRASKVITDVIKVENKLNLSDKTVNTFHGVKQKVIDGIQFRGKVKK